MIKTEKKNVDPQKNVVPMFIVRRIKKKKQTNDDCNLRF